MTSWAVRPRRWPPNPASEVEAQRPWLELQATGPVPEPQAGAGPRTAGGPGGRPTWKKRSGPRPRRRRTAPAPPLRVEQLLLGHGAVDELAVQRRLKHGIGSLRIPTGPEQGRGGNKGKSPHASAGASAMPESVGRALLQEHRRIGPRGGIPWQGDRHAVDAAPSTMRSSRVETDSTKTRAVRPRQPRSGRALPSSPSAGDGVLLDGHLDVVGVPDRARAGPFVVLEDVVHDEALLLEGELGASEVLVGLATEPGDPVAPELQVGTTCAGCPRLRYRSRL